MQQFHYNIAIVGGGIAGLWLFRRLRDQGADVILLEHEALGAGQTMASQGMIHGGQRYTLHGKVSEHAMSIAAMPSIWHDALAGKGIVDLTAAHRLSDFQVMWSSGGLGAKMTTFFASKKMQANMVKLPKENWPAIFTHEQFKGAVYRMDEVVLDMASVIKALIASDHDRLYHAKIKDHLVGKKGIESVILEAGIAIHADHFIFTAGEGNELAVKALDIERPVTQRRPLKQVLVKGQLPKLYGHCIALDNQPRFTVTTHPLAGDSVWYLGGKVSEQGVHQSDDEVIATAQAELTDVFPWLNWQHKQWATLSIDRAEPYHEKGGRHAEPVIESFGQTHLAWPTKLTFAPALAEKMMSKLSIKKAAVKQDLPLPLVPIASYPWSDMQWKSAF